MISSRAGATSLAAYLAIFAVTDVAWSQEPAQDDPTPFSDVELVSSVRSVRPGTPFTVAVHITLDPGWHTYWTNGGDAGDELLVDWSLPEGFVAGELEWPAPHLLPAPPLMSYGYEGQVLVLAEITPPADLAVGRDIEIRGAADFQVCADICVIALDDVAVTLPVRATPPEADGSWAAAVADTRSRLPQSATDWTARAWTNGKEDDGAAYILEIAPTRAGTAPPPSALAAPHLFADSSDVIEHAAPQIVARVGGALRIAIPRNYFADEYEDRLGGVLIADVESEVATGWQIEAAVTDVPPDVAAEDLDPLAQSSAIETGGVPEGMAPLGRPPVVAEPPAGEGLGLWTAVMFALLGGIILNLMPCVFPVLSLKVLGLVERGAEDPPRVRRHGLAFGAGVIVSFLVLAGVLMALRRGGDALGWGFQLQSPAFVGVMALIFFAFGLSLSGVYEVGSSLTRLGALGRGDRYRDSALMGGLTVLVATPCTAPFMGAALGFALLQSAFVGLAVFMALAVGLAAPYVLFTSAPKLLRLLPRSGPWTETLKQALAFPMYATVVWLVWVFSAQAGIDRAALLLFGLTLVAFGAWALGRFGTSGARAGWARGAAVLAGLGAVALLVQGSRGVETQPLREESALIQSDWEPFTPERLAAYRTEGRPVFIDVTADWCLACKVNERIALRTAAVQAAFADHDVALLVADWTNRDPQIAEMVESFGRNGIPLYVLYSADPGAEAEILPAVLTPGIVIDAVRRAADSPGVG